MKKIITIFLVIFSLIFIPNVKALDIARKEKVKIYLFWGSYFKRSIKNKRGTKDDSWRGAAYFDKKCN